MNRLPHQHAGALGVRFNANHGESLYDFGLKSDEVNGEEGSSSVERPDEPVDSGASDESEGAEVPEEPVVSDDSDELEASEDPEAPEAPEGVTTAVGVRDLPHHQFCFIHSGKDNGWNLHFLILRSL